MNIQKVIKKIFQNFCNHQISSAFCKTEVYKQFFQEPDEQETKTEKIPKPLIENCNFNKQNLLKTTLTDKNCDFNLNSDFTFDNVYFKKLQNNKIFTKIKPQNNQICFLNLYQALFTCQNIIIKKGLDYKNSCQGVYLNNNLLQKIDLSYNNFNNYNEFWNVGVYCLIQRDGKTENSLSLPIDTLFWGFVGFGSEVDDDLFYNGTSYLTGF